MDAHNIDKFMQLCKFYDRATDFVQFLIGIFGRDGAPPGIRRVPVVENMR